MEIDATIIEQIKRVILPEIRAAANDALRAFETGKTADGENFFDNYSLGCCCWNNLYNRLNRKLDESDFFKKDTRRRVLSISCPNGDGSLTFYASRVNAETRVPRAGKSIKLLLREQYFLCAEVEELLCSSPRNVYILGYDLDAENGLGQITLNLLYAAGKNRFQTKAVHDFTAPRKLPAPSLAPPENISRPAVTLNKHEDRRAGD